MNRKPELEKFGEWEAKLSMETTLCLAGDHIPVEADPIIAFGTMAFRPVIAHGEATQGTNPMARLRVYAKWQGLMRRRTVGTCVGVVMAIVVLAAGQNSAQAGHDHQPARIRLAVDAVPCLPIVISDRASAHCREVAQELARYLDRITGGKFEIHSGDGSQGIVLGTLAEFPCPALAEGLRVRNSFDGKEAFAIRTEAKRLLLIGATEMGMSHAAFRLLEELGCRRFFPAKEWEVVPSKPTLTVELNATDRPALLARRIWWGYGFFDQERCRKDYLAWARHNRMASSLEISCGHAWQTIIASNKKTFDEHPEYLALVGGKRQGPQLCVSNPQVRKLVAQYALEQFRREPQRDMVSLETSDGGGHCECDACQRLGHISNRVFGLANEVARAVAEKYPGKMVGLYAYNDHCEPPSFPLEPNVYVQSTAGFIRGRYTFKELMDLWPNALSKHGLL